MAGTSRPVIPMTAYAVGLMLLANPFFNLVGAWPQHFGAADWRVQQFGTLVAGLAPATLGVAILLYTARSLDQRRTQVVIASLALLMAVVVAGLFVSFLFDALELHAIIVAEGKGPLARVALKVALQSMVVIPTLALLGVAGIRAPRRRVAGSDARAETLLIHRAIESTTESRP